MGTIVADSVRLEFFFGAGLVIRLPSSVPAIASVTRNSPVWAERLRRGDHRAVSLARSVRCRPQFRVNAAKPDRREGCLRYDVRQPMTNNRNHSFSAEPYPWSGLMEAALAGDRRAYEALLRAAVPVIERFVRGQWPTAQAADIDDVVQETLRSLHAVRHTFQAGRPFLPWLLAIARHRLLDQRRSMRRRAARERALEPADETLWAVPANTVYEGPVSGDVLAAAITQLPDRQRQAVELMGLREMTLKEAAAESGRSVTALKVASHRAIHSLRRALGVASK